MGYAIFLEANIDDILADGLVTEKVNNVSEVMVHGFDIPYYIADSLVNKNVKAMDKELDKLATLISHKLKNEIKIEDEDRFQMHYDAKVKGVNGMEKLRPFTLLLSDGQLLTALISNVEESKMFKGKKEVEVRYWALNSKDITKWIYIDGDKDISKSELTNRLSMVINKVHNKFISKYPKSDLLDVSNVVYEKIVLDTSSKEALIESLESVPTDRHEDDADVLISAMDKTLKEYGHL